MSTLVVEVAPDRESGTSRRWFVPSSTMSGCYWRVDYVPGKALTCSCPHGKKIAQAGLRFPSPRPCRHLRAVTDLELERTS